MEVEKQNQSTAGPEPLTSFRTAADPTAAPEQGEYRYGSGSYQTPIVPADRSFSFERETPRPVEPVEQPVPMPVPPTQAEAEPAPEPSGAVQAAPGGSVVYGLPGDPSGKYPPAWQRFVFAQDPAAPAEPAPTSSKKKQPPRSNGWAVVAVILALLLGLLAGAFGYRLYAGRNRRSGEPSAQTETAQSDLSVLQTPAEIYRANVDAVVAVEAATGGGGQPVSTGTGFVFSADGEIVTNYHVVRGAGSLTVRFSDGRSYAAQLLYPELSDGDIALLKIDASGLQPVRFGDSDLLRIGDPVCTIGNPLGDLTDSLSVGWLSARDRSVTSDGKTMRMLQTDAAINAGSSGGPLFNLSGEVIGVVTTKYSGETASGASVEGLGFAIPINDVLRQVEQMKRGLAQ